jgi:hypothetical protein
LVAGAIGVKFRSVAAKIEDDTLIGDTQTAALVGKDGSIDWACFPRFDSGACFAALLGQPAARASSSRRRHGLEAVNPSNIGHRRGRGCIGRAGRAPIVSALAADIALGSRVGREMVTCRGRPVVALSRAGGPLEAEPEPPRDDGQNQGERNGQRCVPQWLHGLPSSKFVAMANR